MCRLWRRVLELEQENRAHQLATQPAADVDALRERVLQLERDVEASRRLHTTPDLYHADDDSNAAAACAGGRAYNRAAEAQSPEPNANGAEGSSSNAPQQFRSPGSSCDGGHFLLSPTCSEIEAMVTPARSLSSAGKSRPQLTRCRLFDLADPSFDLPSQ